jgi:uncharacterized protein (DUF924 family)
MTPRAVLQFWFGEAPYQARKEWFNGGAAFDELIRERFGALVEAALGGGLEATVWNEDPATRLAQVLVLDQFTRNIFRGTPRAFAGDAQALQFASAIVGSGADRSLHPLQRQFAYLPFEHSEDLTTQQRSVALYRALAADDPASAGVLDYALRHHDIVRRFGRFPHRNAILGRTSTAEELAFLEQPGSRF